MALQKLKLVLLSTPTQRSLRRLQAPPRAQVSQFRPLLDHRVQHRVSQSRRPRAALLAPDPAPAVPAVVTEVDSTVLVPAVGRALVAAVGRAQFLAQVALLVAVVVVPAVAVLAVAVLAVPVVVDLRSERAVVVVAIAKSFSQWTSRATAPRTLQSLREQSSSSARSRR